MSETDNAAFEWTIEALAEKFQGKLAIESKLGEGAMGAVYRARQGDRPVALKVLLPGALSSQDTLARFILEGQILRKLDHPNLLKVYEVGEDPKLPYLVCELVSGSSLDVIIAKEAPFDWARALDVTAQVLAGLKVAHAENIIHRDIKPSNVLVGGDGVCRVADFGIAKASAMATQKTSTGIVMGTPTYMPPELVLGGKPTPAADVYSVGTMLFEMLVGQPPFPGEDVTEIFTAKVRGHAPKLADLAGQDMPKPLERLCSMALAREEADRLPSAAAFLQALEDTRRTMQQLKPAGGATGTKAMSLVEMPTVNPSSKTRVEGAPARATQKRRLVSKPVSAPVPAPVGDAQAWKPVAAGVVLMLVLAGAGIAWRNRPPPRKAAVRPAEAPVGLTSEETELASNMAIQADLARTDPAGIKVQADTPERAAMILKKAGDMAKNNVSLRSHLWLAAGHTGEPLAVECLIGVLAMNVAASEKEKAARLVIDILATKPEIPPQVDRFSLRAEACTVLGRMATMPSGWPGQAARACVRTLGWLADKGTSAECIGFFRLAKNAGWDERPGDSPDQQIVEALRAIDNDAARAELK